jgi:hypothetical protein
MSSTKEGEPRICDKCDRETRHFLKLTAPDNTVQYVCWTCLARDEKRNSLRETWRRDRHGRRA